VRGHPHHHGAPLEPPELSGVDPLSAGVLSAFRKASHLNRQLFMRLAQDTGGHSGGTIVLGMLAGNEGITQRDLAEKMHLARPTVTIMLQKLEQHGLIERWNDPDDQRLTRIRLTDAGRSQSKAMGDSYARYVNVTIGAMSETDRTELARLLGVLNEKTVAAMKELDA
jgi:DNA-binding MarR family transcriptional regulator